MKKIVLTRILSVALALALSLGLFTVLSTIAAKTETKYGTAEEMATGEYTIVVPSVAPTGMAGGAYYIDHATAVNPGFLFKPFDAKNHDGAAVWKITKVSDTQCTIQNPSKGDQGYINMAADYIGYGAKMNLNYEVSAGKFRFFVNDGGKKWYIRFTNSSFNESRFQSGTGEASHEFHLYGTITTTVEDPAPELNIPPVTGDPILTLACISDLHADYGLQNRAPYVRNSVIKTINAIAMNEDADILLVGGDNTSDNGGTSHKGGWTYETFSNVMSKYKDLAAFATADGYSLWAAGNHEFQAGEDEGYDSYADYVDMMIEANGEPVSILRQKDDPALRSAKYPDYALGIHYNIKNFDFIILNAPYAQSQQYSSETYKWLADRLKNIGKDKTVFLITHFPLTDSQNISTPSYGTSGSHYTSLTSILRSYPNVVFLYGHNHGGSENVYINTDTFERITSYTKAGKPVYDRNVVPTSFITSFMGSMSYYNNSYNNGGLQAEDPQIIQSLMIYVYNDRIVFQMKNYGKVFSDVVPKSWTVMRDIEASLNDTPSTDTNTGTDTGTDTGDTTVDTELSAEFLVTTDITDKVKYDSSKSIGKMTFNGTARLESYGNIIEAASFPADSTVSLKRITSGVEYYALKNSISTVVKEFDAHLMTVRQGKGLIDVEGPVRITMAGPTDEFGPYTDQVDLVVYYADSNGVLHMTDLEKKADGTVSFILPELTTFAFSARANVVDDAPQGEPSTDGGNTDSSVDGGNDDATAENGGNLGLILGIAGGACAVVGLGLGLFVFLSVRKKSQGEKKE